MATKKVVIAGAGVAGLSTAHELSRYPNLFEVHVYEKSPRYGGKAASQDATVLGTTGHHLGEHGFRFFPWFYRHLAETLNEIPLSGAHVFDALEESTEVGIAVNGTVYPVPRGNKAMLKVDFIKIMELTFGANGLNATPGDLARLAGYYLKFHTSCHERRAQVYEYQSWADFLGMTAGKYAKNFTELLESVPMMLVAMQASKGSARTLGNVGIQMLYDFDTQNYDKVDAVLQGPTSMTWIEPWVADLKTKGVVFHSNHELKKIELAATPSSPRHVKSLDFLDHATNTNVAVDVSGGYCVCALPINAMKPILKPALTGADPTLMNLKKLVSSAPPPWDNMIGVQYFLPVDPTMLKGHVAYPGSDWALTSISQAQYWRAGGHVDPDLAKQFGIPGLKGVISVIACNWNNTVKDPASPVNGKKARNCSEVQVKQEIWRQLVKGAYPNGAAAPVPLDSHLDENVALSPFDNPTPLLVHPPGSYPQRPPARLAKIDNLVLAGDYIQTNTELATMEGANEAAKRAVSAIYDAESLTVPRPGIYELPEDSASEALRAADCLSFALGLPHWMDIAFLSATIDSFDEIPPDFDTFVFDAATEGLVKVSARSPEGLASLRRYPPPLFLVPSAKIVYSGFPAPEQLPIDLDPTARRIYQRFWEARAELRRFGAHPTREGYRLWERVLTGELER